MCNHCTMRDAWGPRPVYVTQPSQPVAALHILLPAHLVWLYTILSVAVGCCTDAVCRMAPHLLHHQAIVEQSEDMRSVKEDGISLI